VNIYLLLALLVEALVLKTLKYGVKRMKTIAPFDMHIDQDGKSEVISIQQEHTLFEIIHHGRVIGVLKPPGEDWQLLPFEQIAEKIPLFEIDLSTSDQSAIELHGPLVNQIVGEIENRLR